MKRASLMKNQLFGNSEQFKLRETGLSQGGNMKRSRIEKFITSLNTLKEFETKEKYYHFITNWLCENRHLLTQNCKYDQELEMLISLDLHDYCLNGQIFIKEEIYRYNQIFRNSNNIKPSLIIMVFRDRLIELITISNGDCPQCDCSLGMIYWKRISDKKIFMECLACCWMQEINGLPFHIGSDAYVPASKKDLEKLDIE